MIQSHHDHLPSWKAALKIAATYAVIGALWILCSGWLLHNFVDNQILLAKLEAIKGWFYVLVTAALLGWWLNRYFKDISSATDQLRKTEARFASIFKDSPAAVAISRLSDGVFQDANDAFVQLFGYSREEIIGRTSEQLRLWHSGNRPQVIAELCNKKRIVTELRGRHKNGEVRYLLTSLQWIELDGEPYILGTLVDVSERKKAESALREGDERLRFALESCHIGTWDLDLVDHSTIRSVEHARIFGYDNPHSPWSREIFIEHVLLEDRIQVGEKIKRAIETQSQMSFECRIRRLDGQIRWIWVAGRCKVDSDGNTSHLVGVVGDITDRKAHQTELERLSRLYATMSQINQTIVRVNSEKELAMEVARVAVEFGNFKLAWVGRYNQQANEVEPLGWAGEKWEAVRGFRHSLENALEQRCLCFPVVRENRSCVFNDLSAAPAMTDWHKVIGQAGIQAAAVFPIRLNDSVWGVFGVYESELDVFQDKEIALLEETATDIGYALENIDNEAQRRQAVTYQLLSARILGILNDPLTLQEASNSILRLIKQETGLDAVGIRLKNGEDFPYFSAEGLSKNFLFSENSVILRSENGAVCRNVDGELCLQCTCGMVLAEKCGPPSNLVTPVGSFWTNDTLATLEELRDQDPRLKSRDRCIHEGFRSVALIPIRADQQMVGLLHLSDRRKGRFTLEIIHFFEGLAASFGIAVKRKQAEDLLRESEERFRTLFEQAAIGVAEIESDTGRFLRINQRYCDIVGFSREDMMARDFQIFTHPDDLAADLAQREQLRSGKIREFSIEKRYHRKDGALVWVALTVSPLWLLGDAPTRHVEVVQDITDRKNAEAALRESEERLRLFIEHAPAALAMFDRDIRYLAVSSRWLSDFGLEGREILGQSHYEVFPEIGDALKEIHRRGLAGEIMGADDERFERADGSIQYLHWAMHPWHDSSGEIGGIGIFTEDITKRKQAEEALLRSETHIRTLVDTLPDLVWLKDPAGVYLTCNSRFESFFGASEADIVGKTDYDFFDRELADFFRANDNAAVAAGRPRVNEEEITFASDGHQEILETIKTPMFDTEGRLIGVLGIGRDITARRQQEMERANLEAQLHQAQKMESVGRLAGGVAHDFNNMLGVIIGRADMILEQVDPATPLHSDLLEIRQAGERSADLTRQLLAFARKQTVTPKVIDLNTTLAGMAKMLKRLIGEDIVIEWIPGQNLWSVKIDPGQIDQMLANLCVNARDAIAGVGKVTIETGNIVFDEAHCMDHPGHVPGEYVMLAVSDNGCGMDSETMSHLFEPFFTTKELGKGTGLGLATVYGVVKQNNGQITVSSESGQGTTFRIYLPRHLAKTVTRPNKEIDTPRRRGQETILLVEDEPAILKMTRRMLEQEGYTVVEAGTPGEAIRLANQYAGDIHLLVTDVVMPEMNGRDLAKKILSLYPNLKCLFMSGYTTDIIAHRGVIDDGVNFIQKPFSKRDLAAKAREVLEI